MANPSLETNPNLRRRVFEALDIRYYKRKGISFFVNISLSILIFLNCISIILITVPSWRRDNYDLFHDFEIFSVLIFTLEYLLRVWSIVEKRGYEHPIYGRLKFIFSYWGIIELLAIVPFYITLFHTDLGLIRILRLLRIVRLFRMSRYFHAFKVIRNVLSQKREELILAFSFILCIMLLSSSMMYYLEHDVQPTKFSSIPASLWWGVNTMTTVGYGDMFPITFAGKLLGAFVAISGISLFALPAGILASGFNEHIRGHKIEENKVKCPYCKGEFYTEIVK